MCFASVQSSHAAVRRPAALHITDLRRQQSRAAIALSVSAIDGQCECDGARFYLVFQGHYLRQEGYVIVVVCLFVCLSVCLSVSNFAQKASEQICMKFSGKVGNGPMNKWLNFGGNPDHRSGNGYGSGYGSRHW